MRDKSITAKYTMMTDFSISQHNSPEIKTHTLLRISDLHESRSDKFKITILIMIITTILPEKSDGSGCVDKGCTSAIILGTKGVKVERR